METSTSRTKALAQAFLKRVKKHILFNTDLALIKSILQNLNLREFATKDHNFSQFLNRIKNDDFIDMTRFIDKVESSLLNNKSICKLLAYIQDNHLISDQELKNAEDIFELQINLLAIIEAFVVSMANSDTLAEDVYKHDVKRRSAYFSGDPIANFFIGVPKDATFFERVKDTSVKPPALGVIFHRGMGVKDETPNDIKNILCT